MGKRKKIRAIDYEESKPIINQLTVKTVDTRVSDVIRCKKRKYDNLDQDVAQHTYTPVVTDSCGIANCDDSSSEFSVASSIGSAASNDGVVKFRRYGCCERNINHHMMGTFTDFGLADTVSVVALDCEFFGVGPLGRQSVLGRCSIVDHEGRLLCDVFAKPDEPITDYRTKWSGLRKEQAVHAVPIASAKRLIRRILENKTIVGHSLHNDFGVLGLQVAPSQVRDLAACRQLRQLMLPYAKNSIGLKNLAKCLLGRNIQVSEHCSIEDARATMDIYRLVEKDWEKSHKCNISQPLHKNCKQRTTSECYLNDEFWPENFDNNE